MSRTGEGHDHSKNHHNQKPPSGIGIPHSISPHVPCPETVPVVATTDGSYLLVGYPHGEPAAFVVQKDAGLLRHALTMAFGSSEDKGLGATNRNGNSKHTSTSASSNGSMRTSTGTIPAGSKPAPVSTTQARP